MTTQPIRVQPFLRAGQTLVSTLPRRSAQVLSALLLFWSGAALQAAAPGNDLFANAWTLTGALVATNGSTASSGRETGEPYASGTSTLGGATVWYKWTAPASALTRIDTAGSSFNTVLGVYTGTAVNALTLVIANDDVSGSDNTSRVEFQAVAGTTYRIVVDGRRRFSGSTTGNYRLNLAIQATVTITSPANGSQCLRNTPLPLAAEAVVPNMPVAQLDFYQTGVLIDSLTSAPFTTQAANLPAGTNSFFAVATDSAGLSWTSSIVRVLALNPGVTLLAPADGALFLNTNSIPVSAAAIAPGQSITNVEFWADDTRLGADTAAPFSCVWSNVLPGAHRLTARATDTTGTLWTSPPVFVSVACRLSPTGSVWKYLDTGTNLETAWIDPAFDDSAWAKGPSPLGYGDANGLFPATTNSYGPDSAVKYTTTYYRQSVVVSDPASLATVSLRVQRDDGLIVYLNGTEILRDSMPEGDITSATFSSATIGNADEIAWITNAVDPALLHDGTNVLAAEIHQCDLTSSDIWFNLELTAQPALQRNNPPVIALTAPTSGAVFFIPGTITLAATASDPDGAVAQVEFFAGPTRIGAATNSPYSLDWTAPAPGVYTLTAVATDNEGAVTVSAPATITLYGMTASRWTAFNDDGGATSHPNATAFSALAPESAGPLRDIATGNPAGVSLAVLSQDALAGGPSASPAPGSPADRIFGGVVNLAGGRCVQIGAAGRVTHQFTGLNPARRYSLRATTAAGDPAQTNRWTAFELEGAVGAVPAHSAGVISLAGQAALNTGNNSAGDVAGWDQIVPSPEGAFSLVSQQYLGAAPGNNTPGAGAYAPTAIRLEELAPSALMQITSPLPGASYLAPTNVIFSLDARAPAGIARIEFYAEDIYLGKSDTPPYSVRWDNPPPGVYELRAILWDSEWTKTLSAPVSLRVQTNDTPLVALTAPAQDAAFLAPASVLLEAAASDAQGISRVDFYQNGAAAGQSAAAPYRLARASLPAGAYEFFAVATDALGLSSTSGVTRVSVTNNLPPEIVLTQPGEGDSFVYPQTVPLAASASDSDGGVVKVEFYANGAKTGESTVEPYTASFSNVTFNGLCPFYAVATDTAGNRATSAVVRATMHGSLAPSVALTSPTNDASFVAHGRVTLAAEASDSDGQVTNVEFFANGLKIGGAAASPYRFIWTSAPGGDCLITAVAADDTGMRATSAPVRITVRWVLQSRWIAFNDQQQGPASASNDTFYTVSTFGTKSGLLKNIETGGSLPVTLNITNTASITSAGTMGGPASGTPAYGAFNGFIDWNNSSSPYNGFQLQPADTVACVFSGLDPAKVYRYTATGIRGGTTAVSGNEYSNRWTQVELAGSLGATPAHSAGVITSNQYPASLSGSQAAFNTGVNSTPDSGDIVQWDAIVPSPAGTFTVLWKNYRGAFPGGSAANATYSYGFSAMRLEEFEVSPGWVQLTGPSNNTLFAMPADVSLAAVTGGFQDPVAQVEFYANGLWLATCPEAPYAFVWSNAPAGIHTLSAVATDTTGLALTSAVVRVTVISNTTPLVTIDSPPEDHVYAAPATVHIQAGAQSPSGIVKVEFFESGAKLGESLSAPWSLQWTGVPPGDYVIWAVATDLFGWSGTSGPVNITVVADAAPAAILLAPASNSAYFTPVDIALEASATDSDGMIMGVEFLADGLPIAWQAASPFIAVWSNAPAGTHTLNAVAVDNLGVRGTSAPVVITVVEVIRSQWTAYNDQQQGPASGSNTTFYTLAAYGTPSGPVKDSQTGAALPVTLTVTNSPAAGAGGTMAAPAAGTPAYERFNGFIDWYDSGSSYNTLYVYPTNAVGYVFTGLNTNRLYRITATSVRGGAPGSGGAGNYYSNRWTQAELIGAQSFSPAHSANVLTSNQYPAALIGSQAALNAGVNNTAATGDIFEWENVAPSPSGALTVLCKQYRGPFQGGVGSDAAYSFAFSALRLEEFAAGGAVATLLAPAPNTVVTLPDPVLLSALAAGFNRPVTNMDFYAGALWLGRADTSPGEFAWSNAAPGVHQLRVVAADESGARATSAPVRITVQAHTPPLITLLTPADGAVLTPPATLSLTVSAAATHGALSLVQYYANGVQIGESAQAPFDALSTGVPEGVYDLVAVALDTFGGAATSAPARVFVQLPAPPTIASFDPPPGAVANLSAVTVRFTEPVTGVDASDLRINGAPAAQLAGSSATYVFTFTPPAAGEVRLAWAASHGILDRETPANAFNGALPGETALYANTDTRPPQMLSLSPAAQSRLGALTNITVLFSEPVIGVSAGDLLVNGQPAQSVSGSLAGPYTFAFAQPELGTVQVDWAPAQAIRDLGAPANAFAGGSWVYTLEERRINHVVEVLVDGLGAAYLKRYLAQAPGVFSNFARLQAEGASTLNARCDYNISVTLPNHADVFTGRPALQPAGWSNITYHGLTTDSDNGKTIHDSTTGNPNVPYKSSVFDVVHDNGLSTAFIYTKASLTLFARSWNATYGAPNTNGTAKIDLAFSTSGASSYGPTAPAVDEFIAHVQTNALWTYSFLHFDDPDAVGHSSGWGSAAWSNAIIVVDQQVGRVLNSLAAHAVYSNDTILIVTADHGGVLTGHSDASHYTNYTVPVFVWGPGIPATNLYSLLENRSDPGTNRLDFNAPSQPIRNGDTANLALTFLGLPSIPGSSMIPILANSTPVSLAIAKSGPAVTLSWPGLEGRYTLQASPALGKAAAWQSVTNGVTNSGGFNLFMTAPGVQAPGTFYRLKKN